MNFTRPCRLQPPYAGIIALVLVTLLGGCGRNEAQVYRVPKERVKTANPNLPPGWEEAPLGEMRFASFHVKGENGKSADVSVIPLPGLAGNDLANVNRWRGQVNQPAVNEDELAKVGEPVEIAGEKAKLYDQAGPGAGSADKTRILAAILRRESNGEATAWFFKMTGDDVLVAKQKAAFVEYLKKFDFSKSPAPSETTQSQLPPSHPPIGNVSGKPSLPPSHPPIGNFSANSASTPPASSDSNKPGWNVPAGWKEISGGQFLVAKFLINGDGNTQGAVNVSMSAGDGGGLAGNVNRWRNQLELPGMADDEITKLGKPVDIEGGKAIFVDMSGKDPKSGEKARIIGAMVPRKQETWFFKLMGPESLVEQNKDAFTKFVQTTGFAQ